MSGSRKNMAVRAVQHALHGIVPLEELQPFSGALILPTVGELKKRTCIFSILLSREPGQTTWISAKSIFCTKNTSFHKKDTKFNTESRL